MQTKTRIWGALALGAMFGLSTVSTLHAQDGAAPKQGQGAKKGKGPFRRIMTELDLTAEQKAKIQPIIKEANAEMKKIREDAALSKQEKRAKTRDLQQATRTKIEAELTDAQKAKLAEIMKPQGRKGGKGKRNKAGA